MGNSGRWKSFRRRATNFGIAAVLDRMSHGGCLVDLPDDGDLDSIKVKPWLA
jgi:hypothetical protein